MRLENPIKNILFQKKICSGSECEREPHSHFVVHTNTSSSSEQSAAQEEKFSSLLTLHGQSNSVHTHAHNEMIAIGEDDDEDANGYRK